MYNVRTNAMKGKRIQTCTALAEGKVQVRAKRDSEGVRKNKDGGQSMRGGIMGQG